MPPTPESPGAYMAGAWEATSAEAAAATATATGASAVPTAAPSYMTPHDGGAEWMDVGCGDQDDLVMTMLDHYEPYFDVDLGLDAMPPPPPLLPVGEGDGAGDLSPLAPPLGQEPPYCSFDLHQDMVPPCPSPPSQPGAFARQYSRVSLEISGCDQDTLDRLLGLLRGSSGAVKIEIHG